MENELQIQRIKDLEYSYEDENGETQYRTITLYLEIDVDGYVVNVTF